MSSSVRHPIWNYKCFLVGHKFLDFAGNLKQKVFLQPVNSETVSCIYKVEKKVKTPTSLPQKLP